MNALLKKEIRLLLPAWGAGLGLILAAHLLNLNTTFRIATSNSLVPMTVAAAGLFLGLTTFGQELKWGTLLGLLVQPIERKRFLTVKLALLVPAVTTIWIAASGNGANPMTPLAALLTVLVLVTGGLWTSLLCRHTSASLWLTLLTPLLLALGLEWLLGSAAQDRHATAFIAAALLYSLAGTGLAARLFLRWQEAPQTSARFFAEVNADVPISTFSLFSRARSATPALVAKELLLQREGLLLGLVLLTLHLLSVVFDRMDWLSDTSNSGPSVRELSRHVWSLWIIAPIFIGCRALAEERRMNTLAAQMCLPVSRAWQTTIKLAFSLVLGIALGAVVPWLLEKFRIAFGLSSVLVESKDQLESLRALVWVSSVLAFVSFYASTLSRQMLQAFGIALFVGVVLGGIMMVVAPGALDHDFWRGWLGMWIVWPIVGVALLYLAYRNAREPEITPRRIFHNFAMLGGAPLLGFVLTSAIYNRVWDSMFFREEAHGAPQIQGPAQIIAGPSARSYVLLADGRLWVNGVKPWNKEELPSDGRLMTSLPFTPGQFLEGTNWITVATGDHMAAGLKADGTLWNLFPGDQTNGMGPLLPIQIGRDTDWAKLAGSGGAFLAIKTDGSLWGWNVAYPTQGAAQLTVTNIVPARLGASSNWVDAYFWYGRPCVVAADHTVSVWPIVAEKRVIVGLDISEHAVPEPAPDLDGFEADPVLRRLSEHESSVFIRTDRTLWWKGLALAEHVNTQTGKGYVEASIQLSPDPVWLQVVSSEDPTRANVVALRNDGTLWQWDKPFIAARSYGQETIQPKKISTNSDWIALARDRSVADQIRALAADGSLWILPFTDQHAENNQLIAPSARPVKLINLFDTASR
jgi:hypothetical protein